MSQKLIENIETILKNIHPSLYSLYEQEVEDHIKFINNRFKTHEDLDVLIGANPFSLIQDNHKNHAQFIQTALTLKNGQNIFDIFIWAYHTYHQKGFSFRYFYYELMYWIEVLKKSKQLAYEKLIEFYELMLENHDYLISCAISFKEDKPKPIDKKTYDNFLKALLNSNLIDALTISKDFIKEQKDIQPFWEQIILPALYSVGIKWANGEISVGEEHTATSICQRVMSEHYNVILNHLGEKGNILVTTSPKELHQVGARMISDILEIHDFNVFFVDQHKSIDQLIKKIEQNNIKHIIISVTLVSNIQEAKEMVDILKRYNRDLTIYIGGQAFLKNEDAINFISKGYYIKDIKTLIETLNKEITC